MGAVLSGCVLALAIAMGIGRFAFTAILPSMQAEAGLATDGAGFLASLNFLGYLLGAVAAGFVPRGAVRTAVFRAALAASVLTTAGMGLTGSFAAWSAIRFVSGLASAGIFVLGIAMALDALARHGREAWSGRAYMGVGIGIATSGLFAALAGPYLGWDGEWIGLGLLCAVLAAVPWRVLTDTAEPARQAAAAVPGSGGWLSAPLVLLTFAYLLEGGGYIVSGTFLVAMLKSAPDTAAVGEVAWIVAGLAAAPSSLFWAAAGRRLGLWPALILAHLAQAVGIVVPLAGGVATGLLSAALFGGTFVGIVGLTFAIGRGLSAGGGGSARVIAALTAVYGVGQIVAPLPAGIAVAESGSYAAALWGAAGAVALGALLLAAGAALAARRAVPAAAERKVAR